MHTMFLSALTHPIWDSKTFTDMFALACPLAEKMARPIIVYVFLVVVLRIFGKRELTNLNPFDFVVLLTLSNTVQNAIIGDDNTVTGGVVGAFTLLFINYLVVRFLFKHRRLDQLVEGSPTTLVENGVINEKNLAKELLTRAELASVAHRQGFAGLDEIEKCVLEPGGNFYVKRKDPGVDEVRHGVLLKQLEALGKQLAAVEASLKRGT
jgi:uncharacterized membrane protein YcaP (DUF421 family)